MPFVLAVIPNKMRPRGTQFYGGAARSHFIWDHGNHERHFMHGSSLMPELHLYVGHGYFNSFCTRIHQILREKVHYVLSSAYSIDPSAATTVTHVIPAKLGDIEVENNNYQWYCPAAEETSEPSRKATWNKSIKSPEIDQPTRQL